MRGRSFLVLCVVTAVLIGAAVVVSQLRAPQSTTEKETLFPDLQQRVNDVHEVRIEGRGRSVTLARQGDNWVVREADGYPALLERVRQTIVAVSQLRIIEPKTSNPEYYDRLGVEDPKGEAANSLLLELKDAGGKPVAALIVGQPRRSPAPGDSPGLYVRRPDSQQSLLVEGALDLSVETFEWFDRDLFDVPGDRVRRIELHPPGAPQVVLERERRGGELLLQGVPDGKEAKPLDVRRMETIMEGVFVDGARAAANVEFPEDAPRATVITFDGLVIEAVAARVDDAPLVKYSFRHDPALAVPEPEPAPAQEDAAGDEAGGEGAAAPIADALPQEERPDPAAEAARLSEKLSPWVYRVPDYRFELLAKRMDDLVQDRKKAPTPD